MWKHPLHQVITTKLSGHKDASLLFVLAWELGSAELLVLASCPKGCERHVIDWPLAQAAVTWHLPAFFRLVAAPENCTTALCNGAGPSTGVWASCTHKSDRRYSWKYMSWTFAAKKEQLSGLQQLPALHRVNDASPTLSTLSTKKGRCENKGDQSWGGMGWDDFWQQDCAGLSCHQPWGWSCVPGSGSRKSPECHGKVLQEKRGTELSWILIALWTPSLF